MINFSDEVEKVIVDAKGIALECGTVQIEREHLLAAVLQYLAAKPYETEAEHLNTALTLCGLKREEISLYVDAALEGNGESIRGDVHYSSGARESLTYAQTEAKRGLSRRIELGHLFIALAEPQSGAHLDEILSPLNLRADELRLNLLKAKAQLRTEDEDRLTEGMKRALNEAQSAMRTTFCGRITPLHLLLGLIENQDSLAVEALLHANIDLEEFRARIKREIVNDNELATAQKRYSKAAQRALLRAQIYSNQLGYRFVGPDHLLLAIMPQDTPLDLKLFEKHKFGAVEEYLEFWQNYDFLAVMTFLMFDTSAAKAESRKKLYGVPFAKEARNVVMLAQKEALQMNSGHVGTEHLLLGLLLEEMGVATQVLQTMGVTLDKVRQQIEVGDVRNSTDAPPTLTPQAKSVLSRADDEARAVRHNYIGTEHLLLALMRETDDTGADILRQIGLNLAKSRAQVFEYMVPHIASRPSLFRKLRNRFSRR